MTVEESNWVRLVLQWRGSIAPKVFPGVLLCGGLGFLISLLDYLELPVSWQGFDVVITNVSYNLVLGLLLVFRTNTAYERFWEGRKAWATLTANIRSLGYLIWVAIAEVEPTDREKKESTLRLLNQLTATNMLVNGLLEALTTCERIVSTPIPLAYAIYLKRLLLIYCISLPFQVVNNLHWWTSPIVATLSFVLLGIEQIGTEIENPFGDDASDLPLEEICNTILNNIEDLITVNNQEKLEARSPELELSPHASSL